MRVVMIVPTGIGCPVGGHAGDATPAAKVLAEVCDELILHPNIVNGSDLNEMPFNSLYVDGWALDKFLNGEIGLRRCRTFNRILAVVNELTPTIENGIAAARVTIGADVRTLVLKEPLLMRAEFNMDGSAGGTVSGVSSLVSQVMHEDYDCLAVITPVDYDAEEARQYLDRGLQVNPWGGVEAKASREISAAVGVPVAHAPVDNTKALDNYNEVVDPRVAAEMVSTAFLFCVIKGLHQAPLFASGHAANWDIAVHDVDAMVSPSWCWGPPHKACENYGVPIIGVDSNTPVVRNEIGPVVRVKNYLEAAGYVAAMSSGVLPDSVR